MISLRTRLTRVITLSMAALLTVSGVLVWVLARGALMSQFDTALLAKSQIVRAGVEEDDGVLEMEIKLDGLSEFDADSDMLFYEVRSAAGAVLLRSPSMKDGHLPVLSARPDGGENYAAITLADGGPARAVAQRFDAADDKKKLFPGITLVTARRSNEVSAALHTLAWVLLGTGAGALMLMVPLLRRSLASGLRPLETLAARTAAIDVRKLDTRLPEEDSPAEVRPVVTTLNALLDRVALNFTRERRFSSDVAHELRTPVAELKSLAELAVQWPETATPEAFGDVLAIANEMQAVVESLTLLSRTEAGTQPVAREPVAMDALVAESIARHAALAAERGLVFEQHLDPVMLETDPALWRMIATNLIGNAAHHAPKGSVVSIRLTSGSFTVTNDAPNLTNEDTARMFDRFWRKDAARSGYGHSGLGLALVKSLAELLDVSPRATVTNEDRLEMRVEFSRTV